MGSGLWPLPGLMLPPPSLLPHPDASSTNNAAAADPAGHAVRANSRRTVCIDWFLERVDLPPLTRRAPALCRT
jgi:hypothetical protein